jgi:hypothetical protein
MESIPEILQNHNTTPEMAAALIDAGYHPVPIPAGTKGPQIKGWQRAEFTAASFRPNGNIGLRHDNIACVDKDCPEVLYTARRFLPKTLTTGKESTPGAHSWYVPVGELKYEPFTDTDGDMIIELRFGSSHQTVIPPSVHPDTKERYVVGKAVEPVEIDAAELRRSVGKAATAALIARHLPARGRHNIAMHLMGFMQHNGETEEDSSEICEAAWEAVDAPAEAFGDLETIARTTQEKIDAGEPTTGGKRLAEDWDEKIPRLISKFLGWKKIRGEGGEREGNQAQRLIGYAMDAVGELFLDQNGTEHALIAGVPVPLDSGCYGWLRRLFWYHEGAPATNDLLGTVAGQLRAFAEVSPHRRTLHLRAAQHEGAVYLYLGPGRVVRVNAGGWELDPNPPVMFRHVANLQELPTPEQGGSLDLLDDFITAQEPRDHRLAKTWLVLALLADINRPILLAHGPQGSTKTSVQRTLKNVIDPGRPETLKLREKDFEQNINKAFIPFFDNISTISDYMGDELSKAVTGAGNAVRKLYHDDEDVIREYRRAILLNGLTIPTDKPDLIDRTLPVVLRRVPKEERETERRMRLLFEERHPKLLGAVLDALSGALDYHEEVRGLPRLADWAEYAIALYKHLDWGGYDGFMADWAVIEEGQHETTLESSTLAQCVVALMREHEEVVETPTKMLELLKDAARSEVIDTDVKGADFPASASWLWRKLVPIVPTLEAFRISVSDGHEGRGKDKSRFIRIARFSGDSNPPGGDSKEKMLTDQKLHRNGPGTAGDSRTADLPENSKYPTKLIDNDGSVLQGEKNAVPADPAVPKAYLGGKSGDSITDDADPTTENAVPKVLIALVEVCSEYPKLRGRRQRTEWFNRAQAKGVSEERFISALQALEDAGRVDTEVSGDGGLGRYYPVGA